ncbi:hypothetical protein [Halobacillus massiliensis]|uniref:hypothetical protein n=1 Tax=Halobacillus massiliensis TaxID=1926286 RepID=UPI00117A2031|nr:hypothetical protein [Halobacillus massiliensis]
MQELLKTYFSARNLNVSEEDCSKITQQMEGLDVLRKGLDVRYLNDCEIGLYHRPIRRREHE